MTSAADSNPLDWDAPEILALVRAALDEDLGRGDVTVGALRLDTVTAQARIVAKQQLVLAGLPLAERVFRALDAGVRFKGRFDEGARVAVGNVVAEIEGRAGSILSGERTALNFLARLSGIATLTRRFVEAIAGTRARIRDTRKTTALLRALEKHAVRAGGGENHRFGLFDAILIKENHIALAGGVAETVTRARAVSRALGYETPPPIQIEVRSEAELRQALAAGADAVLLDNVPPADAARLTALARRERPACVIEVSGGVKLSNVRAFAEAGVDFISVGALTHSAPAADLSLLVEPSRGE